MEAVAISIVAVIAVAALLLSVANVARDGFGGRANRGRVRVRLRRRGDTHIAELLPVRLETARVTNHGVAWLDEKDVAHSGDPLWFDENPPLQLLRVSFVPRADNLRESPSSEQVRVIDVAPDEGVAAWVQWEVGKASNSLVVLWSSRRRRQNKGPIALRDADAEEWVFGLTEHGTSILPRSRWKKLLARIIERFQNSPEGSDDDVTNFYSALKISGLRGFGAEETIELAVPNSQLGSGLTILVGANNSGKSSVVEAFDAVYRATRQSAVSFAADRRHGGEDQEVRISLERLDGRSISVETLRAGTSEAKVVWNRDRSSTDVIPMEVTVLPSRRQFAAYFSRFGQADRGWASTGGNEFSRSQNRDAFVARLFALHENEERLNTFNVLLHEVTGRALTWSIDLGAQQQYFLRFSEPGGGSHTSDGLGDGLISLLFILDALHDSTPASLIVIDEPELSLHPQYAARLGALLARFSSDRQIVFATHAPALVNWAWIANGARVARIYKDSGRSKVAQPQPATLTAVASGHLTNTHNPHVFGPRGNEVFFQEDGLLVLEGQEDVIYLPNVLESIGAKITGCVFGWGAGGASRVRTVLALLCELHFKNVAVLLDGDEETLKIKAALRSEFPGYCIESHPAQDIRTKPAQRERASKPGLLTEDGLSVRTEHIAETTEALARIDAYLKQVR